MKKQKQVWVSPTKSGKWKVQTPHSQRAIKVVETQQEGFDLGRQVAMNQGAELILQGRDGRIREKNTYGKDPYPPRG